MEEKNDTEIIMRKLYWAEEEIHNLRKDVDGLKEELEHLSKYANEVGEVAINRNYGKIDRLEADVAKLKDFMDDNKFKAYDGILGEILNKASYIGELRNKYYYFN